MEERVKATNDYFRCKLSKYKKETIIEAVLQKLDYTTIDSIAHYCELQRMMKAQEAEEKRINKAENAIDEYNALAKELKAVGVQNFPLSKLQRMQELLEIIRRA